MVGLDTCNLLCFIIFPQKMFFRCKETQEMAIWAMKKCNKFIYQYLYICSHCSLYHLYIYNKLISENYDTNCMLILFLIKLHVLAYFAYSSHNLHFTEWASYISFDKFWKPFPYGTLRQKDHNPVENFFSFCKLGKAYLIYLCDV